MIRFLNEIYLKECREDLFRFLEDPLKKILGEDFTVSPCHLGYDATLLDENIEIKGSVNGRFDPTNGSVGPGKEIRKGEERKRDYSGNKYFIGICFITGYVFKFPIDCEYVKGLWHFQKTMLAKEGYIIGRLSQKDLFKAMNESRENKGKDEVSEIVFNYVLCKTLNGSNIHAKAWTNFIVKHFYKCYTDIFDECAIIIRNELKARKDEKKENNMGMSTNVVLLRSKDDPDYQRKLKALQACIEADVTVPDELDTYFDGGLDPEFPLEIPFEARKWNDDSRSGYEINVEDIPQGVKTIRFYSSW